MPEKDAAALSPIVADLCFFIAQQAHGAKQFDIAEYWYNNVLKINPNNHDTHYALSYITAAQRRWKEAEIHSTSSIEHHGCIAQYNRGLIRLMQKNYLGGFEDYEARLKFRINYESHIRRFGNIPYWNGEACGLLYVSGEQGFGDIIQFSRYLPLIKDKFNVEKIIFEVPETIKNFFIYNFRNNPEITVVSDDGVPVTQYHVAIASLPFIFKTMHNTVPTIKYEAEPACVDKNALITRRFKIGYCYSGRAAQNDLQVLEWNSRRSVDQGELLKAISVSDNIILIPLQPEDNPQIQTWSDTAGVMANCDLIVGVDTGIIHMAAALGVPTLLLNHYHTCWRWELDGDKTVWYGDNLKILRQKIEGDWNGVFKEAKECVAGNAKV